MYRACILNHIQVAEFNQIYNTNLTSIIIKQVGNKYYSIIDCDIKKKNYKKEALKYFN
jgi:hypothetical protein